MNNNDFSRFSRGIINYYYYFIVIKKKNNNIVEVNYCPAKAGNE